MSPTAPRDSDLPEILRIEPLEVPPDVTLRVPGSKSITNRALTCASLARGRSRLVGVGFGDDTEAMLDSLRRLGSTVVVDRTSAVVELEGGSPTSAPAMIDVRQSGTTARFLTAIVAFGAGEVRVDGDPQLRARPMLDLVEALRALGAEVISEGPDATLPFVVRPSRTGRGCKVELRGDTSSQFLSGLLMSGPLHPDGLDLEVTTELVSRPYVDLTIAVMRSFGVEVDTGTPGRYRVEAGQAYSPETFAVEPDASSASYFWAAAAVTGGRVGVEGLGPDSPQGDARFVDLLERMGASVARSADSTTVSGPDQLQGIEADLREISDTAPTLAAIAPFAVGPTRVTGVGFIRAKESDRIANVVEGLRRAGVDAIEEPDGFLIRPSRPRAARIDTHDDHRLAMAFSLLGIMIPGVELVGASCVAKTYPGFFDDLEKLRT